MKFLTRLREPSTWAGLAVLGSIFGVKELALFGAPELCAVIASMAAIVIPEQK
jgi:hypothetical protein